MTELWTTIKVLFTRKYTSPVHLLVGLITAFGCLYFPALAIALYILFAVVEMWQSIVFWYFGPEKQLSKPFRIADYNDQGYTDFWESLVGAFFGLFLIIVLKAAGVL